jgi:hypothetical protein
MRPPGRRAVEDQALISRGSRQPRLRFGMPRCDVMAAARSREVGSGGGAWLGEAIAGMGCAHMPWTERRDRDCDCGAGRISTWPWLVTSRRGWHRHVRVSWVMDR